MRVPTLQAASVTVSLCFVPWTPAMETQTAIEEEFSSILQRCYAWATGSSTVFTAVILFVAKKNMHLWLWILSLLCIPVFLRLLWLVGACFCTVSSKPFLYSIDQIPHRPIFLVVIHSRKVWFDLKFVGGSHCNKSMRYFAFLKCLKCIKIFEKFFVEF